MKVLFQSRVDLFDRPGGDTIQLQKTKDELEKLGVAVDVNLGFGASASRYDIVHLFNLDRCHETYLQALNAKKQGKKVVLSSIHHRFGEIEEYERRVRYGWRRLVNPVFRTYKGREYLKNIYRAVFDPRQRPAVFRQFVVGLRKQQLELLKMADAILPNAEAEAEEIEREFGVNLRRRVYVVPNGVDASFSCGDPGWFVKRFGTKDFVLAVGRIEARKNQLSVVRAVEEMGGGEGEKVRRRGLVLIGNFNPNHPEYCWRVKMEIKRYPWITHIKSVPYEKMSAAYAAAKVHVLASFFETTGLVNCEAALGGCQIVSTNRGYGREYLGDDAFYCDPYDTDSIRQAIGQAEVSPKSAVGLGRRILTNYTWEETAKKTLGAYTKVA